MGNDATFRPIIDAIYSVDRAEPFRAHGLSLGDLRRGVRAALRGTGFAERSLEQPVGTIAERLHALKFSFFARTATGFPLFLTPVDHEMANWAAGQRVVKIRVRFSRQDGWWLSTPDADNTERRLFTFDLPPEFFRIYHRDGRLRRRAAVDMKSAEFDQLVAFRLVDSHVDVITMVLDADWVDDVQSAIGD